MNKQNKYIRTDKDEIVIFPMDIEHSTFKSLNPISAGFCVIEDDCVTCLGDSFSLNLGSKEDDSQLATLQVFGFESAIEVQQGKKATHTVLKEAQERLYAHNLDPLSQRLDEKSPDYEFLKHLDTITSP